MISYKFNDKHAFPDKKKKILLPSECLESCSWNTMVSSGIGTTDFFGHQTSINPYMHYILFCEVMQTDQAKFSRHRTLLLNKIFAVLSTNSI